MIGCESWKALRGAPKFKVFGESVCNRYGIRIGLVVSHSPRLQLSVKHSMVGSLTPYRGTIRPGFEL